MDSFTTTHLQQVLLFSVELAIDDFAQHVDDIKLKGMLFGDFVRSLWVGRQAVDLELFRCSMQGFLRGAPPRNCSPEEFVEAPLYISFMLGVRFLTDHLQGDRYFKISLRGDNLVRAREQFMLFENCLSVRESLLILAAQVLEEKQR